VHDGKRWSVDADRGIPASPAPISPLVSSAHEKRPQIFPRRRGVTLTAWTPPPTASSARSARRWCTPRPSARAAAHQSEDIASKSAQNTQTVRQSSVDAAPLLCAGLTTFSALRNSPARAGDLVAVFGVGGLGHLGVQYARHMGFEVVAIDRGDDRAELSKKLGAHHYMDSSTTDIAKGLQALGGAKMVLATAQLSVACDAVAW
jgi:hypothetical protein